MMDRIRYRSHYNRSRVYRGRYVREAGIVVHAGYPINPVTRAAHNAPLKMRRRALMLNLWIP
jgi:hypothetical protein